MLSHDLTNKIAAIVAHCQMLQLDTRLAASGDIHAHKIIELALSMDAMLHTRECEVRKPQCSAESTKDEVRRIS
jgi:hypothetical protein